MDIVDTWQFEAGPNFVPMPMFTISLMPSACREVA
jgi:hypothetical protein